MNPFTDEYTKNEVEKYLSGIVLPYEKENISITLLRPEGRIDDFLNVNFRNPSIDIPTLSIHKELWMSLSYMECQSHCLPISRCEGFVGTGGLGLGYFTLSAAELDSCEHIDVYEIDTRIIDYFNKNFSKRPGFDKIQIINEDVRSMTNKSYDYFFMDIYKDMCSNEALEDYDLLTKSNTINHYQFWGEERVILSIFMYDNRFPLRIDEQLFFQDWIESGLAGFYQDRLGKKYLQKYVSIIKSLRSTLKV